MSKLSAYPKRANDKILRKLAGEFGVEYDVLRVMKDTFARHDVGEKKFSPQWFQHHTGTHARDIGEAEKINRKAAYYSTAWGMFGIMGYDYLKAGYTGVFAMVPLFEQSEVEQIRAWLTLIKDNKRLYAAMQTRDWAKIVYYYRGIGYTDIINSNQLYEYHQKLFGHEHGELQAQKGQAQ